VPNLISVAFDQESGSEGVEGIVVFRINQQVSRNAGDGEKGAAHRVSVEGHGLVRVAVGALRVPDIGHVGMDILKRTRVLEAWIVGRPRRQRVRIVPPEDHEQDRAAQERRQNQPGHGEPNKGAGRTRPRRRGRTGYR
jgi:hypothetical protein